MMDLDELQEFLNEQSLPLNSQMAFECVFEGIDKVYILSLAAMEEIMLDGADYSIQQYDNIPDGILLAGELTSNELEVLKRYDDGDSVNLVDTIVEQLSSSLVEAYEYVDNGAHIFTGTKEDFVRDRVPFDDDAIPDLIKYNIDWNSVYSDLSNDLHLVEMSYNSILVVQG